MSEWGDPRSEIAAHLECSWRLVDLAFKPEPIPEQLTAASLNRMSKLKQDYLNAAKAANNLKERLRKIADEMELVSTRTGIGIDDVHRLEEFLLQHSEILSDWYQSEPRPGGAEPAADVIARGVARAFVMLGRPLTHGSNADDAEPSTEFCRAVEVALKAFGARTGWKKPSIRARRAFDEDPHLWRRAPNAIS